MADIKRTNSSNNRDNTHILLKAIPTLEKRLVMVDWAEPAILPRHEGSTARWLKDDNIALGATTDALDDDAGTPITYATRDNFHEVGFSSTKIEAQIHTRKLRAML